MTKHQLEHTPGALMDKPYNMHVTEAMDYLEYDVPEHF